MPAFLYGSHRNLGERTADTTRRECYDAGRNEIIGGTPYCVHDNWLYTISVSNSYNAVRMIICVKPVAIDEIYKK